MSLSNRYEIYKIVAGKRLLVPPFHEKGVFYSKMFLLERFCLITDFQTFYCTFCDKLNAQWCQENILSTFIPLQNICKIPYQVLGNAPY